MNTTEHKEAVLRKVGEERVYSSTVLRTARYFRYALSSARVLDLADELQKDPDEAVVGVVDDDGRCLGLVRRDHLFALMGKPFGREVLQRSSVAEIAEKGPVFDAHADVFTVAQELLGPAEEAGTSYHALVDGDGRFRGIVSTQDLSAYLSRITQDDIRTAGRLQDRLIAGNVLPATAAWRAEAWTRAAKGVGGDFYCSREAAAGKHFLCLCDVSGKGVAASLIVSMVWGMLRMYDFRRGLKSLLESVNRSIVDSFHMEKYLTGFFMLYDQAERRLTCADMGHSHVLLLRGGTAHAVRGTKMNVPLGIEPELEAAVHSYRLRPGDALLVYSDGITEQENAEGAEFGEERLASIALSALANQGGAGTGIESQLPAEIDAFRGRVPQQDDMSFLLLEVYGD